MNHGNVIPVIDPHAGGVTAEQIQATTVLSLIQLRRLRFPTAVDGSVLEGTRRGVAEGAARTALAALGLAATVLAFEEGFDLRSRCVLVPDSSLQFELVRRGSDVEAFDLTADEAVRLVTQAADAAAEAGLGWREDELLLRPSDRLAELIRRSREIASSGEESDQ